MNQAPASQADRQVLMCFRQPKSEAAVIEGTFNFCPLQKLITKDVKAICAE